MRETVFHELAHWVHVHGSQAYKDKILALFAARTVGEATRHLSGYSPGVVGKADDFWSNYMGRQYPDPKLDGCEIPACAMEILTDPHVFQLRWNTPKHRAVMEEVFSIFFEATP